MCNSRFELQTRGFGYGIYDRLQRRFVDSVTIGSLELARRILANYRDVERLQQTPLQAYAALTGHS